MSRRYKSYFREFPHGKQQSDIEEVQAELEFLLYKAWLMWKPRRGKFGLFFWSMVRNKLSDQVRRLNAEMRQVNVLYLDDLQLDIEDKKNAYSITDSLMLPVRGIHEHEEAIWLAIAYGHKTATDLQSEYGRKTYYGLIEAWKSALR